MTICDGDKSKDMDKNTYQLTERLMYNEVMQ